MMAALTQKRRGFTSAQWRDLRTGLFFISPWLLGFFLWTFYPLFSSLYYSFHRYDLLRPAVWVGLKNYVEIFTKDPTFWQVAYNTVYFVGFGIPLGVIGAFLMAT
ncbi:MAG: sugar ABC transporter permease, partial [Caldilineaceae bacterium]|nr:sugar ABC transporter permease [Caldilineaceae bacterium]